MQERNILEISQVYLMYLKCELLKYVSKQDENLKCYYEGIDLSCTFIHSINSSCGSANENAVVRKKNFSFSHGAAI